VEKKAAAEDKQLDSHNEPGYEYGLLPFLI
jgi:hypothetical protein